MKKSTLIIALLLGSLTSSFATNGIPEIYKSSRFTIPAGHTFYNIFFTDDANSKLFIDFAEVAEQLELLNIWRSKTLMLEDQISDLPGDTIYELNLDVIRAGTYTIELVTEHGIRIQKEIVIK